jgi:hypothetical protein
MAKYHASKYYWNIVEDSSRIRGGYGFSKEYETECLYCETPMLLIGEGTGDIQHMIIGRRSRRSTRSAKRAHHRASRAGLGGLPCGLPTLTTRGSATSPSRWSSSHTKNLTASR